MSRNGSGTYTLPAGNPVVTGTTITSSWANATLSNIADALTQSVSADGQTPITGAINMTGHLINNVTDPVSAQDAATKNYVDAINSVVTGTINMWPTASAPTGYLLCQGSAVSRATYAALFAIIGTTFGVGDGTTTFNLPNYTNRMPYGATVGTTGGSADAVVVSHTHTATSTPTDPGHWHYQPNSGGAGGTITAPGGQVNTGNSAYTGYSGTAVATTGITVATTNASTGVSGTNANLPPYLGITFIIKA